MAETPEQADAAALRQLQKEAGRLAMAIEQGLTQLPAASRQRILQRVGARGLLGLSFILASWRVRSNPDRAGAVSTLVGRFLPRLEHVWWPDMDANADLLVPAVDSILSDELGGGARMAGLIAVLGPRLLASILGTEEFQTMSSRLVEILGPAGWGPRSDGGS